MSILLYFDTLNLVKLRSLDEGSRVRTLQQRNRLPAADSDNPSYQLSDV
jgi:hypothetical protein